MMRRLKKRGGKYSNKSQTSVRNNRVGRRGRFRVIHTGTVLVCKVFSFVDTYQNKQRTTQNSSDYQISK